MFDAEVAAEQLRKGVMEYCLLRLIADRERHGFALLESPTGLVLSTTPAAIYAALRRLQRRGFVVSRVMPSRRGPDRRLFEITEMGTVALQEFVALWHDFAREVDARLALSAT